MSDLAAITDTMQAMTLVGFIVTSVLAVAGWKRINGSGRYIAAASLSYTVPGALIYVLFVFFQDGIGAPIEGLLSVMLRWASLILVAVGLVLAIHASRGLR